MKPMVPVGARTVTWEFLYPYFSPWHKASSQHCLLASYNALGTFPLFMPFTDARCMRITSRNGSRLMYQPGQAPPGMTLEPRFVSARLFFVASVAGTSGSHCSAMRLL